MNRHTMGIPASAHPSQFRGSTSSSCPDCETRFPLQTLIAELLRKNQSLRIELQEVRDRLAQRNRSPFDQDS
jgi:hypothetical protein